MNRRLSVSNRILWVTALGLCLLPRTISAAPGDLYVANNSGSFDNQGIFKFSPAGVRSNFGPKNDGHIFDLAFDRARNLFAETSPAGYDGIILKFAPDGTFTVFSEPTLGSYSGLAFDGSGNLFAGETETGLILKFTPSGMKSTFTSVGRPSGQTFDRFGNLFVCDVGDGASGHGTIVKITPAKVKSTFASGLSIPNRLAFDSAGNLFVSEYSSGKIFKFGPAAVRSTFASGLGTIRGLAFDGSDNLFVSDATNLKILKFTPTGAETVFASGVGTFDFVPGALAFEPNTEKLRNVSARGVVRTGENVLIGGFILGGNSLANNAVIARAIGPSLANFGVARPLLDPKLELRNASGALVASNDNWQSTQAAQITASGLAPSDPRESAIFATLPAGAFTAVVRGGNDAAGVALVEIYSLSN